MTHYLRLLLGATTAEGGYACFLFARDNRRLLSVAPGDELIIELEEVPGVEAWGFAQLPEGFEVIHDVYIRDHTWTKDGKRRKKGHEMTAAERRFVLKVAAGAEPGLIVLGKVAGGQALADWRVEIEDTKTPVVDERSKPARSLDEKAADMSVAAAALSETGPRSRLSDLAAR